MKKVSLMMFVVLSIISLAIELKAEIITYTYKFDTTSGNYVVDEFGNYITYTVNKSDGLVTSIVCYLTRINSKGETIKTNNFTFPAKDHAFPVGATNAEIIGLSRTLLVVKYTLPTGDIWESYRIYTNYVYFLGTPIIPLVPGVDVWIHGNQINVYDIDSGIRVYSYRFTLNNVKKVIGTKISPVNPRLSNYYKNVTDSQIQIIRP